MLRTLMSGIRRLLAKPVQNAEFAGIQTLGDLLAMSGCYGLTALLCWALAWPQ